LRKVFTERKKKRDPGVTGDGELINCSLKITLWGKNPKEGLCPEWKQQVKSLPGKVERKRGKKQRARRVAFQKKNHGQCVHQGKKTRSEGAAGQEREQSSIRARAVNILTLSNDGHGLDEPKKPKNLDRRGKFHRKTASGRRVRQLFMGERGRPRGLRMSERRGGEDY